MPFAIGSHSVIPATPCLTPAKQAGRPTWFTHSGG